MKTIILILLLILIASFPDATARGKRCTGAANCTACINCTACAYCNAGKGTCGVCNNTGVGAKSKKKKLVLPKTGM